MKSTINRLLRVTGHEIRRIAVSPPLSATAHDPWATQRALLQRLEIDRPTILDIGANNGSTTALYRRLFPLGRVYSFEPFPEVFELLSRRFSTDDHVVPVRKAVADRSGSRTLFVNASNPSNSLLPRPSGGRPYYAAHSIPKGTVEVQVTTVDDFVRETNLRSVDIMKLDIQGGELLAFQGATETLRRGVPIVYTESMFIPHYEGQPLLYQLWSHMESLGYTLFRLYELEEAENGQLSYCDALFVNQRGRTTIDASGDCLEAMENPCTRA